jgi:glycosyltransferase involved in cell wall biosynthesis
VFAPGAVRHPLRPVFRSWFSAKLRQQCLRADGVAYVTTSALQKRYPCRAVMMGISDVILPGEAFTTTYSSVELAPKQIASTGRSGTAANARPRVVFIGSLEQLYKAPEILIEAVARTRSRGLELELSIVGDGRYRPMLESLASKLSLSEHCRFLGQLPGGASVQTVLDDSDLFVLPSRVEGLPRAMIEAMARGLPCIGSTVGGIPELLDPVDLVAPGDAAALASTIEAVLTDPERQKRMSFRNLERARQYEDKILKAKRREFYRHVLRVTRKFQSVSA